MVPCSCPWKTRLHCSVHPIRGWWVGHRWNLFCFTREWLYQVRAMIGYTQPGSYRQGQEVIKGKDVQMSRSYHFCLCISISIYTTPLIPIMSSSQNQGTVVSDAVKKVGTEITFLCLLLEIMPYYSLFLYPPDIYLLGELKLVCCTFFSQILIFFNNTNFILLNLCYGDCYCVYLANRY